MTDHITASVAKMFRGDYRSIVKEEQKSRCEAKKQMRARIIVGFAPILSKDVSSIIASYVRVPLSAQAKEAALNLFGKYGYDENGNCVERA